MSCSFLKRHEIKAPYSPTFEKLPPFYINSILRASMHSWYVLSTVNCPHARRHSSYRRKRAVTGPESFLISCLFHAHSLGCCCQFPSFSSARHIFPSSFSPFYSSIFLFFALFFYILLYSVLFRFVARFMLGYLRPFFSFLFSFSFSPPFFFIPPFVDFCFFFGRLIYGYRW